MHHQVLLIEPVLNSHFEMYHCLGMDHYSLICSSGIPLANHNSSFDHSFTYPDHVQYVDTQLSLPSIAQWTLHDLQLQTAPCLHLPLFSNLLNWLCHIALYFNHGLSYIMPYPFILQLWNCNGHCFLIQFIRLGGDAVYRNLYSIVLFDEFLGWCESVVFLIIDLFFNKIIEFITLSVR